MKHHIHYTGRETARYTTTLDLWLDAERVENVTEDVTIIADLFIAEITEDDDGKPLPLWAVGNIVTSHCCGRKICEDDEDLIIQSFLEDLSSSLRSL